MGFFVKKFLSGTPGKPRVTGALGGGVFMRLLGVQDIFSFAAASWWYDPFFLRENPK